MNASPPIAAPTGRPGRTHELQRRREMALAACPTADPAVLAAVIAVDPYWTETERWRAALADGGGPPEPEAPAPQPKPATTEEGNARRLPVGRLRKRAGERSSVPISEPGHRLRSGAAAIWTIRVLSLFGPVVLAAGVAFAVGVNVGSSRLPAPAAVSDADARTYHLNTFPQTQAIAFGTAFLTVCLTHPSAKDQAALDRRAALLASWTTSGATQGCGWDESGSTRRPVSVSADGTLAMINGQSPGQTARLGFLVIMDSGEIFRVQLPIWVLGSSVRVAGQLGIMPAPIAAPAPPAPKYTATDPALAGQLTSAVLTPFLTAWGKSDAVQLDLQLTGDASTAARQGMGGVVSQPQISQNKVVVVTGEPGHYTAGAAVTALVTVSWATAGGGQTTSYAIGLRMEADRWLITDIAGATLDPAGGAAPTSALPTTQHQRKDHP